MKARTVKLIMLGLVAAFLVTMAGVPGAAAEVEDEASSMVPDETDTPRPGMEEVRQRIIEVRNRRLKELLKLDDAAAGKLFALLDRQDEEQRTRQQERFELMGEVRGALQGELDDKTAAGILKKLKKHRTDMYNMQKDHKDEIEKMLTPSQTLKYLVFERRFNQEIRRLIATARSKQGGQQQQQQQPAPAR